MDQNVEWFQLDEDVRNKARSQLERLLPRLCPIADKDGVSDQMTPQDYATVVRGLSALTLWICNLMHFIGNGKGFAAFLRVLAKTLEDGKDPVETDMSDLVKRELGVPPTNQLN